MQKIFKISFYIILFLLSYINVYSFGSAPPKDPTIVDVTAFITDIQNLDEVNEQIQIDAIFKFEWNDPRLAFDAKEENTKYKLYQGNFQYDEIFEGWRPQVSVINEIGDPKIKSRQIRIYPNGHVIYKEQRTLTLETPMQLEKFPFDKQTLNAYIIPFGYNSDEVKLRVDPSYKITVKDYVKNHPNVNIAEWQLKDFKLEKTSPIKQYYGKPTKVSMLKFSILLDRKSTNIVLKVLVPLSLLVLAMWSIFWMNPKSLSDRLNIAFIGILSVIAYQFVIQGDMPRIDYLTFIDGHLLTSYCIVFIPVIQSLIVYRLCLNKKISFARFLDNIFRLMFPLGYFIAITILVFKYIH